MKQGMRIETMLMAAAVAVGLGLLAASTARAHCDTMNGPVVPEAKAALEKGDVSTETMQHYHRASAQVRAAQKAAGRN